MQTEDTELLSKEGGLQAVNQIVRSCHASKPSLRPSAAYVAEQLFDIISSRSMDVRLFSSKLIDAKVAISHTLETFSNIVPQIDPDFDPDHWASLETAHSNGDPIASALIGQAIWRGVKPMSIEGNQMVLAPGRDANESKD